MHPKFTICILVLASVAWMPSLTSQFARAKQGHEPAFETIDFFSDPVIDHKSVAGNENTAALFQQPNNPRDVARTHMQKTKTANEPTETHPRKQTEDHAEDQTNDFVPYPINGSPDSSGSAHSANRANPAQSIESSNFDLTDESWLVKTAGVEAMPRVAESFFVQPAFGGTIIAASRIEPTNTPKTSVKPQLPHILTGADKYTLAAQPKLGAHFRDDRPITDPRAYQIETLEHDFSPGPNYDSLPYLPSEQQNVYAGKKLYANQRPLLELGRPWYQLGQLSPGVNWFGKHNTITPQFLVYGDYRSAIASNSSGGDSTTLIANELNLDIDLRLTGTERFHAFMSPLDNGLTNTRYIFDDENFIGEFDANFDFGYFEGDLGAMVGGLIGETMPFDFPFAVGVMPLLIQNGVWFEDAFLGVAATIPARNSARFNISNMDVTFFAGYDKITSDAFPGDDSAARLYGVASFIEAMNGYFEVDYAFLDDRTFDDRSYHNFAFAFTRRYGRLVSNSTRVIVNAGQSTDVVENTADGVLLLSENSLITSAPSTFVPYFNFFAGFDRPQSAARAVQAGGILRNTGILFESDGMTGYPTLDATANDTYGAALGLNIIADDFSQQLVLEMAALGVMGNDLNRNAAGQQYGLGFRYQLPLSNSVIFRADGMYGFLDNAEDISGIRMEIRQKW